MSGSVLVRLGSRASPVSPGSLTSASWLLSMSRAGWEPLWIWPAYAARVPGSPGFPGPRREECDLPLPSQPMATRTWFPDGPRGFVPSALRSWSLPESGGTSRRSARRGTARRSPVSRPARRAAWRASRGESSPISCLTRRCPPRPSREDVSGGDPARSAAGMRWDPDMAPVAMPRERSRDRHRQRLMSFRSLPLPSISRDPRLGHASRTYASRRSASPRARRRHVDTRGGRGGTP